MGILIGLAAAGAWLILWLVAWNALRLDLPVGVAGLVLGLAAVFGICVRLAHPRFQSDPVSRVEQRKRARERFEARVQQPAVDDRAARLAEADREADARAEARVRAIMERRRPAAAATDEASRSAVERADQAETGTRVPAGEGRADVRPEPADETRVGQGEPAGRGS
jgi:hypothetical protein